MFIGHARIVTFVASNTRILKDLCTWRLATRYDALKLQKNKSF
jgi:hypothetical protein